MSVSLTKVSEHALDCHDCRAGYVLPHDERRPLQESRGHAFLSTTEGSVEFVDCILCGARFIDVDDWESDGCTLNRCQPDRNLIHGSDLSETEHVLSCDVALNGDVCEHSAAAAGCSCWHCWS